MKIKKKAPPPPVRARQSPQITVRLNSPELEEWLDRKVAALQAAQPAARVTISQFVRTFLYDAMQADTASPEGGSDDAS